MFKKVNYIYAIYREGSFTKAAEKLYISQPCLSSAVKRVEQLVGGPLFERRGNGAHLTELGVEYIRTAEQILALEEEFFQKARDIHGLKRGTVRVGGSNYISSYILPRILERFTAQYPDVTISLTEADSAKLTQMLQQEQLDLVVDSVDGPAEEKGGHVLLREKILLAVPGGFDCNRLLEGKGITPAKLFEDPLSLDTLPEVDASVFHQERFVLLKDGHSMHRHAMEVFRQAGFMPKITLFLDQLSTSYSLCAQGNGCCFVSDMVFRYHRFDDDVQLYKVAGSGWRSLAILGKQGKPLTPVEKAFSQIAGEAIR